MDVHETDSSVQAIERLDRTVVSLDETCDNSNDRLYIAQLVLIKTLASGERVVRTKRLPPAQARNFARGASRSGGPTRPSPLSEVISCPMTGSKKLHVTSVSFGDEPTGSFIL